MVLLRREKSDRKPAILADGVSFVGGSCVIAAVVLASTALLWQTPKQPVQGPIAPVCDLVDGDPVLLADRSPCCDGARAIMISGQYRTLRRNRRLLAEIRSQPAPDPLLWRRRVKAQRQALEEDVHGYNLVAAECSDRLLARLHLPRHLDS